MKTALRGLRGSEYSLAKYIKAEGGTKKFLDWDVQPHCKCCGNSVHVFEKDTGIIAHFLAEEKTPGYNTDKPGFYHAVPSPNCPSFFKYDPALKDIAHHSFDVRTRTRNLEAIHDAKEGNARVLNLLMFHLTGRDLTQDKRRSLYDMTIGKFLNMEILGTHPWLLPYLLVAHAGHHEREHPNPNKKYPITVEAIASGKRELGYTSYAGEAKRERIPTDLAFMRILVEDKKMVVEPLRYADKEPVTYPLTVKKYLRLAQGLLAKEPTRPEALRPQHPQAPTQLDFNF